MTSQVNLYETNIVSEVLVFKTDLKTKKEAKAAGHILDRNSSIIEWSIDNADMDNILRVVTAGNISEYQIIKMLRMNGFHCEALLD